jgi:hypothetical protein
VHIFSDVNTSKIGMLYGVSFHLQNFFFLLAVLKDTRFYNQWLLRYVADYCYKNHTGFSIYEIVDFRSSEEIPAIREQVLKRDVGWSCSNLLWFVSCSLGVQKPSLLPGLLLRFLVKISLSSERPDSHPVGCLSSMWGCRTLRLWLV